MKREREGDRERGRERVREREKDRENNKERKWRLRKICGIFLSAFWRKASIEYMCWTQNQTDSVIGKNAEKSTNHLQQRNCHSLLNALLLRICFTMKAGIKCTKMSFDNSFALAEWMNVSTREYYVRKSGEWEYGKGIRMTKKTWTKQKQNLFTISLLKNNIFSMSHGVNIYIFVMCAGLFHLFAWTLICL